MGNWVDIGKTMIQLSLLRSEHGTTMAAYRPTGVLCCVDEARLGDEFIPIIFARPSDSDSEMGFLIASVQGQSIVARPFTFLNSILPVAIVPGNPDRPDGRIGLLHPGSSHRPPHISAEMPSYNQHFGQVTANRQTVGAWETFELVDIPPHFVPDHIQAQADRACSYARTDASTIGAYAHFSDDALARTHRPPPLRELVTRFQSLGQNCEFGFAQRHCGAEPLGLLRFGGGFSGERLAQVIASRFDGFGQVANMRGEFPPNDPREVIIHDDMGPWAYHTWRDSVADMGPILQEESMKIRYLSEKLVEDMEDGEKIFVLTTREEHDEERINGVFSAIRKIGPSTLLSVVIADQDHPSGTVIRLREGFLRGYIDAFAPIPGDPPLQPWIRICRNAFGLLTSPG